MPVFLQEEKTQPGYLQEYSTPKEDVFGLAYDSTFDANPSPKILSEAYIETNQGGNLLSKESAEKRLKETGTKYKIPDTGIRDTTLEYIIERRYQERRRQQALALAEEGSWFRNLTGSLAASMTDPLNIAAGFIPIVGTERYAQWLANASGPIGRAGVRFGAGAIEGAVGNAVLEPLNIYTSYKLQEDYTLTDSLANIVVGGLTGGVLRTGAGAIADFLPSKTKGELAQTASAQFAEDKNINLDHVLISSELENSRLLQERLDNSTTIKEVLDVLDSERLPITKSERLEYAKKLDPEAFDRLEVIQQEQRVLKERLQTIEPEVISREAEIAQSKERLAEISDTIKDPELPLAKARELGVEELALQDRVRQLEGELVDLNPTYRGVVQGLDDFGQYSTDFHNRIKSAYRQAGIDLEPKYIERVRESVKRAQQEPENSRLIDEPLRREQEPRIQELEKVNMQEPDKLLDEVIANETANLKEFAARTGQNVDSVLEALKDIDSSSKDAINSIKELTNCVISGGSK